RLGGRFMATSVFCLFYPQHLVCGPPCPLIPRHTERSRNLYSSRGAVEREFGRLKHEWALLPLRVRGLDRVRLHADLTILAKLASALARARVVPLAV
ncbi:MAG: transposase, partial [Actinobacteria bacterium]|nr:transposase [Actinomycetota bacterium]